MRRLALILLLAFAIGPSTGSSAGCSPLDCAPTATSLNGHLLAFRASGQYGPTRVVDLRNGSTRARLPVGILTRTTVVHQDGAFLTWFDATFGERVASATIAKPRGLALVGTSVDGRRAVLARAQRRKTTFAIVDPRSARSVTLDGNWGFDTLRGADLYVLQYLRRGYEVRLYDLAHGRLAPHPLKDSHESALIKGVPWERLASADGRYLFTLYISNTGGAMIHELDLRARRARCIDLPGDGDFNAATGYGLALSPSGAKLWAASAGYGLVAAIDTATAKVHEVFKFTPSPPNAPVAPAVALSPRGDLLALALAGHLWLADLPARHVRPTKPHVAIALGFSPNGRKLWMVGERTRITALTVR